MAGSIFQSKWQMLGMKESGVEIAMETEFEGAPMGFIRDNAGNLIEINQAAD